MTKKRTKLEIIKDILIVLKKNKKVKITHLIYKSNLSNNSIKIYLDDLIENKLIFKKSENGKMFFEIGKKGQGFLDEFDKIKVFSDSYGL